MTWENIFVYHEYTYVSKVFVDYFIQFLQNIIHGKKFGKRFWVHYFGPPYHSNGNKKRAECGCGT